ncbi:hypothetical protein [Natrinema salifodinae]|uniref:hypothetical protein n=1 Tax=Natrinema salifodinae TaxID=1202768 RepID=UPI00094528A0|nr:hypothetical protein [Natrinema salifodinae]
MDQNPIEKNPITRIILGLVVVIGMSIGAHIMIVFFSFLKFPYAPWIGAIVGSITIFLLFSLLYREYYV